MAIHKMVVRSGQKPTEEQRKRIRRAASMPITYDEDCPELTEEQYEEFARIAAKQRAGRKKRLVSIRVSPDTLEKAKALPCVFNNYAVFYKGEFVTVNLTDAAALKKILKK